MRRRGLPADDRGMVTIEAAFAIASIVAVVVISVVGVASVAAHIRCIDAAREVARIAAQGDSVRARDVGRQVAPRGATVTLRAEGTVVEARVRVSVPLLTMLDVSATAVAALEPVGADQ
ncbi:TadE family type IV pilus minor pilin [Nocardia sp. 348MFTsu5.1]|uniref:TadE family type IV pilus minor pilin n=1 Tax=Nocardia sp. 348MFTsu5.1 TaxID=1172185 RepID=UPI00055EA7C0|nr:TadE family type IV pilus minor pilin [Nocardia sp. 348MFTsu5.1]